jgi:haloalkane dehalogenase
MSLIRPPESQFRDLPNYDYEANFVEVGEPEMAYVDVGEGEETFLCLHGEPTWSFLYRKMIPTLKKHGRVIVPDFVGFGRSDRYEDPDAYSYSQYYDWLETFLKTLDLTNITLICQDWGGLLGLPVATRNQERFARLVPMNTGLADGGQEMPEEWWAFHDFVEETPDLPISFLVQEATNTELSDEVLAAYDAPFPDVSFKGAARAWPLMVPTDPSMDGASIMGDTLDQLGEWEKPAFVLYSDSDPITSPARDLFRELIPTAIEQPDVWIEGPGHFLQEEAGEEIAEHVVDFVRRT